MRDYRCYPDSTGRKDVFRLNYISRKPIYDFFSEKSRLFTGILLDYGCGNMPYKSMFDQVKNYIGLDVETAQNYGFKRDGVTYYDGVTIPFEDNFIDGVISSQVLEHVENIENSFKEIFRVLKPGGIFCFTVPMVYVLHMEPYDFRRFTYYGIEKILKDAGFDEIEIKGSNCYTDTVRFLAIGTKNRFFRKMYAVYCNFMFIVGESRLKKGIEKIENKIRKMIGKQSKQMVTVPLNYLVCCKKGKKLGSVTTNG